MDSQTATGQKSRKDTLHSTQTHLSIGEIHDDVLVLKNGGVRSVLQVSSINFNLKSEQEQNSIIYSYQGFLNSLEFPVQIVVRSKKLDIDDYIEQVEKLGEKQENPLLQEQTYEYAEYVKKLVEYADIMEKQFYVIVPYDPGRARGAGIFQTLLNRLKPQDKASDIFKRKNEFEKLKKSLLQRVNVVKSGLENCGLKVEELKTPEIIQMFYESLNPVSSQSQKIKDLENTQLEKDNN